MKRIKLSTFTMIAFVAIITLTACGPDYDPASDGQVTFNLNQDGWPAEKVSVTTTNQAYACGDGAVCADTASGYHIMYPGGAFLGVGCSTAPGGCWWDEVVLNSTLLRGRMEDGRKLSFYQDDQGDFLLLWLYNWPEDHSEYVLVWLGSDYSLPGDSDVRNIIPDSYGEEFLASCPTSKHFH